MPRPKPPSGIPLSRRKHSCPECGGIFARRENAVHHLAREHPESELSPKVVEDAGDSVVTKSRNRAPSRPTSNSTAASPPPPPPPPTPPAPSSPPANSLLNVTIESSPRLDGDEAIFLNSLDWCRPLNEFYDSHAWFIQDPDVLRNLYHRNVSMYSRGYPQQNRSVMVNEVVGTAFAYKLGTVAATEVALMQLLHDGNPTSESERLRITKAAEAAYGEALKMLPTAPGSAPNKLLAFTDLYAFTLEQHGSKRASALLPIGKFFALLSQTSDGGESAQFGHPVSLIGVVDYFDFFQERISKPNRSSGTTNIGSSLPNDSTAFGLPTRLFECFTAINSLEGQIAPGQLLSPTLLAAAISLEDAITSFRSEETLEIFEESFREEGSRTIEMWRQAARIYLYQTVRQHGPLSSVYREAVSRIIELGSLKPPNPREGFVVRLERAFPWFIASTVAIDPASREICHTALVNHGSNHIFQENLRLIRRLWDLMDNSGWTVDWRELAQQEDIRIGFM